MKISIKEKKELLGALSKVQGVAEKRTALQLLTNIYLHVGNDLLTIKATDLEISMETSLPVHVEETGGVTASAKNLFEIVKELPLEQEVEIASKDNHWIEINCGSSKFNIMGIAPENYPALPDASNCTFACLAPEALMQMIDRTLFAVSIDETRYHLNGVYLEKGDGNRFKMVATDTHRLVYCEKELFAETPDFLSKGIIIPRKGVQELRKLLDVNKKKLAVSLNGNHLIFKDGVTNLFIRLIEGIFPDYQGTIPKNNQNFIKMDTKGLIDSLKRVSLLANEKSRGVRLKFQGKKLKISTNNPDMGEAKESVNTSYEGDILEVSFNARYLMDSVSVIDSEQVLISLNNNDSDRMSPGVIQVPGSEDYLCVLMPMSL